MNRDKIWQYQFHLLPRRGSNTHLEEAASKRSEHWGENGPPQS